MQEPNTDKPATTPDADTTAGVPCTGTVKSFDVNRKYGFITHDDGTQVFVHQEALPSGTSLATGDRVSFEMTDGAKGPRAESVRKL